MSHWPFELSLWVFSDFSDGCIIIGVKADLGHFPVNERLFEGKFDSMDLENFQTFYLGIIE